jgi:hypothetical protein
MKTDLVDDGSGGKLLMFWCEGCRTHHGPRVQAGSTPGPVWDWNWDRERPTIQPSILVQGTESPTDEDLARMRAGETVEPRPLRCHSFLTDGRLQYLGDCSHALAGTIVDLKEMN